MPPIGADILSVIGLPFAVAPIVRHHHENWDGTGYPDGIAGEAIPVGSRILAVVDCFDALTSDRPYRPRMETEEALRIISDRRGNMYDPQVVDAFFPLHAGADSAAIAPVETPALVEAQSERHAAQPAEATREDLEFETVFDLGRAIGRLSTISTLGDTLWTHSKRHMPASAFVWYTYDEVSDTIVAVYEGGTQTTYAARLPLGDRLSGWVAATRQTAMNSDARLDFDESVRELSPLRTALVVPIVVDGRCGGVLSFYAERTNAFDEGHQRFVERLSRLVGEVPAESMRIEMCQHLEGVSK